MLSVSKTATPRIAPRKKAMERDSESKASRSQSMALGDITGHFQRKAQRGRGFQHNAKGILAQSRNFGGRHGSGVSNACNDASRASG